MTRLALYVGLLLIYSHALAAPPVNPHTRLDSCGVMPELGPS
jgi:hypothetical protein